MPFVPNLGSYTGCRAVRGSHGIGHKRDVLGTDMPPAGWPYPPVTREEVARALGLMPEVEHPVAEPRSNAALELVPPLLRDIGPHPQPHTHDAGRDPAEGGT